MNLSAADADVILEQQEIDPIDPCVNARILPEQVSKYDNRATITAEWIHGLVCPSDQKQVMSVVDA